MTHETAQTREALVEVMARAMCSALTGNESAYDNPRNYERESFQMEAEAALLAFLDAAAGDEKPGQGWLHDAVKDASERAGKNASVAPQLLYAPILWAMQDALSALKTEVKP